MESIWMGIAPGLTATRVIAMAGPSETILKAQLASEEAEVALLSKEGRDREEQLASDRKAMAANRSSEQIGKRNASERRDAQARATK